MHPVRIIKRILDKFLGTNKSDELSWKFRHFFDKNWAKSYVSDVAIKHPHRKLLVDEISKLYPFKKVLEIGSASGANLYLLAKKFSEAKFYGVDVSYNAINEGKKFFEKKNIKNVFLKNLTASQLESFEDKSMDIVFSDASIIYVGKDKINKVFEEIFRITKKLLFCVNSTQKENLFIMLDGFIIIKK